MLFQNEREDIQTNLMLAQSMQNNKNDNSNMERLQDLLTEQDSYEQMIQEENAAIRDLDKEIRAMEKEIISQHKTMGGVHSSQMRHVNAQKQCRVLENRLDKATVEFNKMLTSNAKLRDEIDHLRYIHISGSCMVDNCTFGRVFISLLDLSISDCADDLFDIPCHCSI